MKLPVKLLHDDSKTPAFAYESDAGMDLFSYDTLILKPGERAQVPTGIACAIPDGFVGLIWDKSGLSHRTGLKVLGGVIDAGFRGEILVGLVNLGDEPKAIQKGDKISQMLIQRIEHPVIEVVAELDPTVRGGQGFGSTGQ